MWYGILLSRQESTGHKSESRVLQQVCGNRLDKAVVDEMMTVFDVAKVGVAAGR